MSPPPRAATRLNAVFRKRIRGPAANDLSLVESVSVDTDVDSLEFSGSARAINYFLNFFRLAKIFIVKKEREPLGGREKRKACARFIGGRGKEAEL